MTDHGITSLSNLLQNEKVVKYVVLELCKFIGLFDQDVSIHKTQGNNIYNSTEMNDGCFSVRNKF